MSTSTGSEDPETVQSSSSARHELCVQHQMRNPSQMLMDEAEDERFKVELVICRFHSTIEVKLLWCTLSDFMMDSTFEN